MWEGLGEWDDKSVTVGAQWDESGMDSDEKREAA